MRIVPVNRLAKDAHCMRHGCPEAPAWVARSDDRTLGLICRDCAAWGPDFVRGLLVEEAQACLKAALPGGSADPASRRALLRRAGILLCAAAEEVQGGPG